MYVCPVCEDKLQNTPYYKTEQGKVCEDCYESKNGTLSKYQKYMQKQKNLLSKQRRKNERD